MTISSAKTQTNRLLLLARRRDDVVEWGQAAHDRLHESIGTVDQEPRTILHLVQALAPNRRSVVLEGKCSRSPRTRAKSGLSSREMSTSMASGTRS